jgi:hypothetical protein
MQAKARVLVAEERKVSSFRPPQDATIQRGIFDSPSDTALIERASNPIPTFLPIVEFYSLRFQIKERDFGRDQECINSHSVDTSA